MNKSEKCFLTYRRFETKFPFVNSLTPGNCQNRKHSHSHTPPHSMVRPSSKGGKPITHKQAVHRQKYPNCHTWSWWQWYLSILGISCTRYLLMEQTIENTETSRKGSTWIPTKHIFSPDQFFTTCLSSRANSTSNTTLSHPPPEASHLLPTEEQRTLMKVELDIISMTLLGSSGLKWTPQ